MTFTYDQSLSTPLALVRFHTGDRVSPGLRSDEEIAGILAIESNVYRAASIICDSIAAEYSQKSDQAIDDMRKSLSQLSSQFAERATRLEARAESSSGSGEIVPVPFAGGISVADKRTRDADGTRVPPFFDRADMDFGDTRSVTAVTDDE